MAHRRGDALTGVRWGRLKHLLAANYRDAGYQVEHVVMGAIAGRFHASVDLKPRRDGRPLLVQIKHWNVCQMLRSDVHQLIGLRVNAKADGRITGSGSLL